MLVIVLSMSCSSVKGDMGLCHLPQILGSCLECLTTKPACSCHKLHMQEDEQMSIVAYVKSKKSPTSKDIRRVFLVHTHDLLKNNNLIFAKCKVTLTFVIDSQ